MTATHPRRWRNKVGGAGGEGAGFACSGGVGCCL